MQDVSLEKIVSLAKRRGFIFPGSEIYGGLAGTWDYGPYGVALKQHIKDSWWRHFVSSREDVYGVDTAILMNEKVWEASGHTGAGFVDPMVEDLKTQKRYRADHLLEEHGIEAEEMSLEEMTQQIQEKGILSPDGNQLSDVRQFNLMFKTEVGALGGQYSYLRPETAQGMFVNFKNIVDTMRPRLPFGIAQIGKSFRNEITPRDFIFRLRELEIMEFEYFVRSEEWEAHFETLLEDMQSWFESIGVDPKKITRLEVPEQDRAHYSKRTVDFEFAFPFGVKELYGLAYRTDFDLKNHSKHSGTDLVYRDPITNEVLTPHVIEPTFGVERTMLALLCSAYQIDTSGEEERVYLAFPKHIAPVRAMVAPLLKNKPELVEKAREIFSTLKNEYGNVVFDDNGNIGKRYRRQDEIGTPFCITIDFETLEDESVTVRDRDTGEQRRVAVEKLIEEVS